MWTESERKTVPEPVSPSLDLQPGLNGGHYCATNLTVHDRVASGEIGKEAGREKMWTEKCFVPVVDLKKINL